MAQEIVVLLMALVLSGCVVGAPLALSWGQEGLHLVAECYIGGSIAIEEKNSAEELALHQRACSV
jgi:hypothetical protein